MTHPARHTLAALPYVVGGILALCVIGWIVQLVAWACGYEWASAAS